MYENFDNVEPFENSKWAKVKRTVKKAANQACEFTKKHPEVVLPLTAAAIRLIFKGVDECVSVNRVNRLMDANLRHFYDRRTNMHYYCRKTPTNYQRLEAERRYSAGESYGEILMSMRLL